MYERTVFDNGRWAMKGTGKERAKIEPPKPALVVCGDGLSLLPNFIIKG